MKFYTHLLSEILVKRFAISAFHASIRQISLSIIFIFTDKRILPLSLTGKGPNCKNAKLCRILRKEWMK